MSATPDSRVLKCFGQPVEMLELPDSQLFPIEDILQEVENFNQIQTQALKYTFSVIERMAKREIEPGHILIFTSGNQRINSLITALSSQLNQKVHAPNVQVIKNLNVYLDDKKIFYEKLEEYLELKRINKDDDDETKIEENANENPNDTLFFIPIKFAGFIKEEAKEIAKNPIPNHPNVIKIIVATNAIESSITINGLACVVDCGVCNNGVYKKDSGLTFVTECAISKQSQVQRRGRVGRIRNGICVQITIKNNPPQEFQEPKILTSDISSNILNLRRMGIYLEEVENLPDPVPKEKMEEIMNELISINALDSETKKLTNIGRKLSSFPSMSPFLASAILSVSEGNKNEDHNIISLLSSLVVLIFSSKNLCTDPYALQLQKNFNEDSDIITLLRTFLDVMINKKGKTVKTREHIFSQFGLNGKSAVQMAGTVNQIMSNIYFEELFREKDVWKKMDDLYRKYENDNSLMSYIQSLITHVGQIKEEWIKCRRTKFLAVCNVLQKQNYIFEGDSSLCTAKSGKSAIITINNCRPGGCGFSIPGAAFIMQISHNNDNDTNYGDIVHRDISYKGNIPHPTSIIEETYLNNIFSVPLIKSFIGKEGKYVSFHKKTFVEGTDNINELICMPKSFLDKTAFSVIPKDEKSLELFKEAINKIKPLIPFTPRCVIVNNDSLKCAIAIISNGTDKYQTEVIFYDENCYTPYQMDKQMIEYLLQNKENLNSITGDILIAVTGENFIYSSNSSEEEILASEIMIPSGTNKELCVFSNLSFSQNHLIVLSKHDIPNGHKMSWIDKKISIKYVEEDVYVHAANSIGKGFVRCSHLNDKVFIMSNNPSLDIIGNDPKLSEDLTQSMAAAGFNDSGKRIIGAMFDRYAMNCVKGTNLIKNVELESFTLIKDHIVEEFTTAMRCYYFIKEKTKFEELMNLLDELDEVKKTQHQTKKPKELHQLKERKQSLEKEILSISSKKEIEKGGSYDIKNLMSSRIMLRYISPFLCNGVEYDFKYKNSPVFNLNRNSNFIEIHNQLSQNPNIGIEKIPVCQVKILHRTNLKFSKDKLMQKVDEVCAKFGGVIIRKPIYIEEQKKKNLHGTVVIDLYTVEFSIPFVGEIVDSIIGQTESFLQIPSSIIPTSILSLPNIRNIIKRWLTENNFKEISRKGFRWCGPKSQTVQASILISRKQSSPKIPYKIFMVPGGLNIDNFQNDLNRTRNNTWIVDKVTRKIIVPDTVEDAKVQLFLSEYLNNKKTTVDQHEDIGPILGDDIYFCENDAILSGNQVAIYHKDGSTTMRNFCVTCVFSILQEATGTMFDFEESLPVLRRIAENNETINMLSLVNCEETNAKNGSVELWPVIPLGQLMWSLVCEPMLCSLAKTWFTAITAQALHSSLKTTYCPCHSATIFRHPGPGKKIKCTDCSCRMYLCDICSQWHLPNQCKYERKNELPQGYRFCPNCKAMIYKTEACNHISCRCGKHFCYYCGGGPWDDSSPTYNHLSSEHGGCHINPPDYKKFCLNDSSVSDQELKNFYEKYPQFK